MASTTRPIPMTADRAVTELIQCRGHLEAARESLELALEIFDRLEAEASVRPPRLEEVLGRLEEAEAALRGAMR